MKKVLLLASFSLVSLSMVAADEANKGWWPFGSSSSTPDIATLVTQIQDLNNKVAALEVTINQLNTAQLCEVYPVQQNVKVALTALAKIISYIQLSSMYLAQACAGINNELAQVPFLAELLATIAIQTQEAAEDVATTADQAACNCGDNCACGDNCPCGDNCVCAQNGTSCGDSSCPVS